MKKKKKGGGITWKLLPVGVVVVIIERKNVSMKNVEDAADVRLTKKRKKHNVLKLLFPFLLITVIEFFNFIEQCH